MSNGMTDQQPDPFVDHHTGSTKGHDITLIRHYTQHFETKVVNGDLLVGKGLGMDIYDETLECGTCYQEMMSPDIGVNEMWRSV